MKTNSTDLEDFREFFHEADKKTEEKKRCGEKKMAKIVEKRQCGSAVRIVVGSVARVRARWRGSLP